jgi:hypothetical protein
MVEQQAEGRTIKNETVVMMQVCSWNRGRSNFVTKGRNDDWTL